MVTLMDERKHERNGMEWNGIIWFGQKKVMETKGIKYGTKTREGYFEDCFGWW